MSGGNIHAFARRGNLPGLRQQVEEFAADVNEPDVHKMTPLHYGAKRGHLPVVQYLIQRRADPELRNGTGQTPLLAAAQNGQAEVVDALIASGADPNAEADHGIRALHRAAAAGYEDIVRILLKGRADPLAIDGFLMEGAVHHAAREGHADVVRTLMGSVTRPQRPPEGAEDVDFSQALREASLLSETTSSGLSGILGLKAQSIDEGNSRGQSLAPSSPRRSTRMNRTPGAGHPGQGAGQPGRAGRPGRSTRAGRAAFPSCPCRSGQVRVAERADCKSSRRASGEVRGHTYGQSVCCVWARADGAPNGRRDCPAPRGGTWQGGVRETAAENEHNQLERLVDRAQGREIWRHCAPPRLRRGAGRGGAPAARRKGEPVAHEPAGPHAHASGCQGQRRGDCQVSAEGGC